MDRRVEVDPGRRGPGSNSKTKDILFSSEVNSVENRKYIDLVSFSFRVIIYMDPCLVRSGFMVGKTHHMIQNVKKKTFSHLDQNDS